MKLVWKLTLAQLKLSRIRLGVSLLAMVIAVALSVWLMGAYDALISGFDDEAERYLGDATLLLSPLPPPDSRGAQKPSLQGEGGSQLDSQKSLNRMGKRSGSSGSLFVPKVLIDAVAADPDVSGIHRTVQTRVSLVNAKRYYPGFVPMREQIGPSRDPLFTGTDALVSPFEIVEGRWFDLSASEPEGVLGLAAAERLGVHAGDSVYVYSTAGDFFIRVSGLIRQEHATPVVSFARSALLPGAASFWTGEATAEKVNGYANQYNLVYIQLKDPLAKDEFVRRWEKRASDAGCAFSGAPQIRDSLAGDRSANALKSEAYATTGMALLSAVFIIFTTLSMGLNERMRQLTLLRALGVSRFQVGMLMMTEALILAVPAWAFGIFSGVWMGWFLEKGGSAGVVLSWTTVLAALLTALAGALIAAVWPMIQAMRIAPLEPSVQANTEIRVWRTTLYWTIPGLILMTVNPFLIWVPGLELATRKFLYMSVGYPTLAVGFLCLTPLLIRLSERAFLPLTAKILCFDASLLKRLLTGNLWRTVGTAAALTLGLSLYTSFQFWGYTMVVPFQPDRSVPDAVAVFMPGGIDFSLTDSVRLTEGVEPSRFLPIQLEQPKISPQTRNSPPFKGVDNDNFVFIGAPLEKAFEGKDPMFDFEFTLGEAKSAFKRMRENRGVLIPETLQTLTLLQVGDTFTVLNPDGRECVYSVAGAVHFPGWHWLSKHSGLRKNGGFTAGVLFADSALLASDFPPKRVEAFWFDIKQGTHPETLEAQLQKIADAQGALSVNVPGTGSVRAARPYVKLTTRDGIVRTVGGLADRSIAAMSQMPLMMLLLATLAVMNTLMASVRARRREWGMMRAIGVSRSQVLRMLSAEALMIGLTACVLSLTFGIVTAKCMVEICQYGFFFGGVTPPLQIPWEGLLKGFGFTLVLCWLAALIPAAVLLRSPVLTLLDPSEVE